MALILASTSPIRRAMLDAAGVAYRAMASKVDEAALMQEVPDADAAALAEAKALAVSALHPDDDVIGSDSIIAVDGQRFDKPADRADAADHLRRFSGKTMALTSAVAIARRGIVEWRHSDTATLTVRPLSEEFIGAYLDAEWPDVAYCVGVFRMEGRGVQLFDSVAGSHFTILGMPLLPLLAQLRARGLMPS